MPLMTFSCSKTLAMLGAVIVMVGLVMAFYLRKR